ncbi:hypothetical protein ANN_26000, partial [Periplaneta americana]
MNILIHAQSPIYPLWHSCSVSRHPPPELDANAPLLWVWSHISTTVPSASFATGVDGIPIELLKCLGEDKKEILSLCNKMYEKGDWREDFMETVLLPVPKKNNAKKCNEFRTISLISHSAKILLRILNRRLYSKIEEQLEEEQFGFRQGKIGMDTKSHPKSIKLPDTVEVFGNLKNAKRFAIDIGGSLTKIAYYSTVSHRRVFYEVEKEDGKPQSADELKVRIYKTVILLVVLYGCETWTLTLREEQRLRVFENKMLRKIFGAKKDEVTEEWRKLHNAELDTLYSPSPPLWSNGSSCVRGLRRCKVTFHQVRNKVYRELFGLHSSESGQHKRQNDWEKYQGNRGGAYKYTELLQQKLGLSVDKEDEMACLIKGCNFLLKNISDEAFVYQRHGNPEYKFQTADPNIFPYLLVNIGSGVSIMK